MTDAADRFRANPFLVLALPTTATRAEVERAAQKWLAMLEVGHRSARLYATPIGPRLRTPELVREAIAELRDPDRRITHELWCARSGSGPDSDPDPDPDSDSDSDSDSDPDRDPDPDRFDALRALRWAR